MTAHLTAKPRKSERVQHAARKRLALRKKAGELETRAMSLTRTMATIEGERARILIEAEVLRWRADELEPITTRG